VKTAKRVQKAIAKLTDTPIDMQTEDVAADTTASPSREERERSRQKTAGLEAVKEGKTWTERCQSARR